MRGRVHQGQEEGVLFVALQHLLQNLVPRLLVLLGGGLLLLLGVRLGAGLRVLLEEVEDLEGRVGGQGLLLESECEVVFGLGDRSDALLEVLLALLLDLVQLEEELLGVGSHLRSGARLNRTLNKFPIFPVHHEGWNREKDTGDESLVLLIGPAALDLRLLG